MSELQTKEDLAGVFKVDIKTIGRWRDGGILPPPVQCGPRLIRWRRVDIEQWIEGGCIPCYKTKNPTRGARA